MMVAGIAMASPETSLRAIGARLEAMRERTPVAAVSGRHPPSRTSWIRLRNWDWRHRPATGRVKPRPANDQKGGKSISNSPSAPGRRII